MTVHTYAHNTQLNYSRVALENRRSKKKIKYEHLLLEPKTVLGVKNIQIVAIDIQIVSIKIKIVVYYMRFILYIGPKLQYKRPQLCRMVAKLCIFKWNIRNCLILFCIKL